MDRRSLSCVANGAGNLDGGGQPPWWRNGRRQLCHARGSQSVVRSTGHGRDVEDRLGDDRRPAHKLTPRGVTLPEAVLQAIHTPCPCWHRPIGPPNSIDAAEPPPRIAGGGSASPTSPCCVSRVRRRPHPAGPAAVAPRRFCAVKGLPVRPRERVPLTSAGSGWQAVVGPSGWGAVRAGQQAGVMPKSVRSALPKAAPM